MSLDWSMGFRVAPGIVPVEQWVGQGVVKRTRHRCDAGLIQCHGGDALIRHGVAGALVA